MTVSTPHYSWKLPDPGGSASTWGNLLNGAVTAVDAALWDINAHTAVFAGDVLVKGAFTASNGFITSEATGSGNANFAMANNAGTDMGFLYWTPTNQIILQNQTGGGSLTINADGSITVSGVLHAGATNAVSLGVSGSLIVTGASTLASLSVTSFSCIGNASISGNLNTAGYMAATGTLSRNGISGTNGVDQYNHYWTGSQNHLFLNNSDWGVIQTVSDYRMKKDVAPLDSMWEQVKALNPIRYTIRDWTPPASVEIQKKTGGTLIVGNDIEQWGFLAHELQETLVESAANGVKDDPVAVQSPNPFTVIAALARALQEAMTRIEALEAAR